MLKHNYMYMDKITKALPARNHRLDGLKVLVADDDQVNILIIRKILSRWDIEVSVAENGIAAVEMAINGSFDIILMDVQMPGMDGLAASREIQKFNKDIPIVVVTSLPYLYVEENFGKIGITKYVFKPVNIEYMYQILLKYALKKSNGLSSFG